MQRRDFARTLLLGAGAVCTLTAPVSRTALAAGTKARLHAMLARERSQTGRTRWQPIDSCRSDTCAIASRIRVDIESIAFTPTLRPLVVDAMLDTHAGLRPFRIASFQPDSHSPASKPFSFEIERSGLAGFRGELVGDQDTALHIGSVAALGPARPALDPGRYMLAFAESARDIDPGVLSASGFDVHQAPSPIARLIFTVREPAV